MKNPNGENDAHLRMKGMLEYVEQFIKLDENVAYRLDQHRLPDGTQFSLHQHELHNLPGLHLDSVDDDGPIWLRIERLTRTRPPEAPPEIAEWIAISNDPNKPCTTHDTLRRRVSIKEKDDLLRAGEIFEDEIQPSLKDEPDSKGNPQYFDLALRLEKRPDLRLKIDSYRAESWASWAEVEKPRRKSIAVYQKLFEIAQLLMAGNLDQSELTWGIGLSKWRTPAAEIDLPIITRGVEIQIAEDQKAEIVVRPREQGAQLELRAFRDLAYGQFNIIENAARDSLKRIELVEPEGVSPFRAETFEAILRICSSQLDPEGRYLPEHEDLQSQAPVPAPRAENLTVSDRFVLFARRRAMNVVIADIERLKATIAPSDGKEPHPIEGAARTLVIGPSDGIGHDFVPLGSIGTTSIGHLPPEEQTDHDHGDLFFPKPFNDDQIAIVRRLEKSDGLVVQGPPGTGKTHTIANIISHMLATGKRILVISHGETALSVVREQLPPELRDLAISVTTSDRDGERQVEKAASLMLEIVNNFTANHTTPQRRIASLEQAIIHDRKRLKEIDAGIARIAEAHLSTVPGSNDTPFDLAQKLMAERDVHSWFPDRPKKTVLEAGLRSAIVEAGLASRRALGPDLKYLDVDLIRSSQLPDRTTLENWRVDLLRAAEIEASTSFWSATRKILAKISMSGAAQLLHEIEQLISSWKNVQRYPWANLIFDLAIQNDARFVASHAQLAHLSSAASDLGNRAQAFVARSVSLPTALPPGDELQTILEALADGKNPFGLFAFKLKRHQPTIEEIRIGGAKPNSSSDWQYISMFISLKLDVDNFFGYWDSVCSDLQIEGTISRQNFSAVAPMGILLDATLSLPASLTSLQERINVLVEDRSATGQLTTSREQLEQLGHALSARLSHTRLLAVRQQIEEAKNKIPADQVDIHLALRKLLDRLGDPTLDDERLFGLWDQVISKLDQLHRRQPDFQAVHWAANDLSGCGAPMLASWIRSEIHREENDLVKNDWQSAWNWWALYDYLNNISARKELSELHKSRTDTESQLRSNFAELVRERAFYALAGSMTGTAKAALKAFADLVRRLGKGTGKRAPMLRREMRSAMHKCFDAVPCWIMPAWRVSEQLPSEIGSFDLVILDEASQSDAKEIPALLRGKKVLIVGDDRQVSPTDAFIKQDDIERLQMNYLQDFPFPVHLLPGSSIYDLARVMFPDKFVMLKEHFRCVEPIIRFSMQFYNEPLIPLRVPTANERLDPPLIDIYVPDGQRPKGRKINPREADIIVDEIENLINDPSYSHTHGPRERPRTIGVISLIGGEQARYIQQRIIERIGEPKFIEHRILCGDSATMQGNERDIVFLSMVSGSEGRISSQTAEQYQRRFNVALSRARDRMILVRSVDENRLNPNDLKAKVIRHFQDPMPASASPDVELIELCQSGFERAIFTRLSDRGYTVRPQVGSLGYSIDLVVEGNNGQRLAIECDGDLYHGPDRWADDMRRQRILERVGWVFWRVFGSVYSLDPDGVFEDLVQTLERLGIKPNEARPIAGRWTEHRVVSTTQELPQVDDEIAIASDPPSTVAPLLNEEKLELGDKIVLRYIDKPDSKPVSYVLTDKPSDPHAGLLNIHSPLAKQLAEIDVGDEFEFKIDASEQRILYVAKQSVGSMAAAAE